MFPLQYRRKILLSAAVAAITALAGGNSADPAQQAFRLPLRSRAQAFRNSDAWHEVRFQYQLPIRETAILICDMWDNHWCSGAARRVNELVVRLAPVVDKARARGIQIIHSPSDVMDFYKGYPQRKRIAELPKVEPPPILSLADPPLPIDDSDGGCDTNDQSHKAWTRQHAAIHIAPEDVISDKGIEVYSFLHQQGIRNLLVMGVHTNMCVLNRTFAIKQMTKWGIHCILVRDLTDTMYDPKDRPFVSHEQGTELVVQHIEKYWCLSTLSSELTKVLERLK